MVAGAVLDRRRALGGFSLVDRFGAPVAPAMTVVFAAVAVLPAFAGSPVALGVVLLVLGAASGATDVAINAAGVRAEIRSQRPVMNLAHAWFSVCVAVASLSTAAPRAVGAGPRLVLLAASSLVAVITVVALVPGALRLRDQSGNGDILAISELRTPWPGGTTWRPATPLIISRMPGCPGVLRGERLAKLGCRAYGNHAQGRRRVEFYGVAVAGLGTSVCAPTVISLAGRWAHPRGVEPQSRW